MNEALDETAITEVAVQLSGGEIHRRTIELERNDFFHAVVEQRGIDVAVTWLDANSQKVWEVDSPNGANGPEELVVIAPQAGLYTIEITAWTSASPGTITYRELAQRPATPADRKLVAADRTYHELRKEASTSPRQVIEGLEPVAELWRSRGLYQRDADTQVPLCDAYLAAGDSRSALTACERAITWYRAVQARHLLAPALRRAATAHLNLGELESAIRRSEEGLEISRQLEDREGIIDSYQRLAAARRQSGELQAALDAYDDAQRSTGLSLTNRAAIARERARVLLILRQPHAALEALHEAERTYRTLKRTRLVAFTLSSQAEAHVQLKQLQEAESLARQAVELLVSHDDPRGRAIVLKTLGSVLRHAEDFSAAQTAFENSLDLFARVEDRRGQAVVLTELGHVLRLQGNGARALERHQEAFQLFEALRDSQGQTSSRIRGAQALADLGRFQQAWDSLKPALEQLETTRQDTARSDYRLAYFAFRREYLEIAVDILMRLHAHDPAAGWHLQALKVHDRGLARELVDAEPRVSTLVVATELLEQERALEQDLRASVAKETSTAIDPASRRGIGALLDRLHQVRGQIRQTSSKTTSTTPPPELKVADVQSQLGDRDLLLVYALGDQNSYLWSLTQDQCQVETLERRNEIEPWAQDLLIALLEDGDSEPRQRLGDLLLTPTAERLQGRQRLLVVADGALHQIPFAVLPPPGAPPTRYLLEDHEIVTLPSLAALIAQRQRQKPILKRELALFADPVFDADDPRLALAPAKDSTDSPRPIPSPALVRSLRAMRSERPLERLPGTREEAQAIGSLLGKERARIRLGLDVERRQVLEALAEHRIVHFATHGLSHPEPGLSGLVLSLVDESGQPSNGFLQTLEIARLDLQNDLVVLSACQTARGKILAGEGALGLAWGFLKAGATGVVASLWQVADASTAQLMTHFYQHLDQGLSPPAALRQAQLVVASKPQTTPYDWAAFVFQGDWRESAVPAMGNPGS